MYLQKYLYGVHFLAVLSAIILLGTIFMYSPARGGMWSYVLLYGSLFVCASSLSMMSLLTLWQRLAQTQASHEDFVIIERQGVLVGVLITALVLLQQFSILFWWNTIILTCSILVFELYFITRDKD